VRWTEVTEEGFRGGPVMPDNYDGSAKATDVSCAPASPVPASSPASSATTSSRACWWCRCSTATPGRAGAGQRIDCRELSTAIEKIRTRVEADGSVKLHVISFAKLVGD
jgi:hypothetical protein